MEKYAVFIDIDGTLYDKGYIHPENIRAINEASAAGHYMFINTGRGYSFVPKEVLECADFYGVVAGLGSNIVIGGKSVKNVTVETDLLKQTAEMFKNTEVYVRYQGEKRYFFQNCPDNSYYDPIIIHDETDVEKYADIMEVSKITCFGTKPSPEQVEFFKKRCCVVEYDHCIEVTSKGQGKPVGMFDAAKIVGVEKENCIAIGDSENDLDVLEAAGIGVAMGNASDEVKKICEFVTTDCRDGGVAYAIDKLVLKK